MKRILSLLLVCMICLGLCACGESAPKEIQLTVENIEEYLSFETEYEITDEKTTLLGESWRIKTYDADQILKVYPICAGKFENVQLEIEVPLYNNWYVDVDPDTTVAVADVIFDFNLPVSGEYESSKEIHYSSAITSYEYAQLRKERSDNAPSYVIKSVSGQFVKD